MIIMTEFLFRMPHGTVSLVVFALQLFFSVTIAFSTMAGSSALVALFCITDVLPIDIKCSVFVMFPVIGVLAYSASKVWSITAVLVLSTAHSLIFLSTGKYSDVLDGLVVAALYCIALLIGIVLRQKDESRLQQEQLYQQKQAKAELAELKGKQYLAKELHDSVTRELSAIAMLSWHWIKASDVDGDTHGAMKQVYDNAQSALNNMHHVVDLLKESGAQRDDSNDEEMQNSAAIDTLIKNEQKTVTSLGYRGDAVVQGSASAIDVQVMSLILGFIRELYANIIRHTAPGADSYMIFAAISDSDISITQTNTMSLADGVDSPLSEVRHGLGLEAHRNAIENAGGSMRYRVADGSWFIYVTIPSHQPKK